jgi:hypothetical protein
MIAQGCPVTFIVKASKGEEAVVTVRLSAAVAIAKAQSLCETGWQVTITAPDGACYCPSDFGSLLAGARSVRSSA